MKVALPPSCGPYMHSTGLYSGVQQASCCFRSMTSTTTLLCLTPTLICVLLKYRQLVSSRPQPPNLLNNAISLLSPVVCDAAP